MFKWKLPLRIYSSRVGGHFSTGSGYTRSTLPDIPLLRRVGGYAEEGGKLAAVDETGESWTYGEVLGRALSLRRSLMRDKGDDLKEAHIAFLLPNSSQYVATQWGIWSAGGVAVPLCTVHPPNEIEYILRDASVDGVVLEASGELRGRVAPIAEALGIPVHTIGDSGGHGSVDRVEYTAMDEGRDAMMIYTSGTTGRPKGVVTTHRGMRAQVESLVEAWGWTEKDRILHTLPLHHVHGVINALVCAHYAGATVEFAGGKFDAGRVWRRWASTTAPPITLFTGVPTMYSKLLEGRIPEMDGREATRRIRLMMSGSSSLSMPLRQEWKDATGHTLLERYGMTETGMITGGDPKEASRRVQGCVGWAMPGVEVRLEDGEVQVRGKGVFREYWGKRTATEEAFTMDGWFRTGDTGEWDEVGGLRLRGRASMDIIKTGGYKVSAIEVEGAILEAFPEVGECAVIGLEDATWGQSVVAVLVGRPGKTLPGRDALHERLPLVLAPYKVPRRVIERDVLPRNIMGKVDKKRMMREYE